MDEEDEHQKEASLMALRDEIDRDELRIHVAHWYGDENTHPTAEVVCDLDVMAEAARAVVDAPTARRCLTHGTDVEEHHASCEPGQAMMRESECRINRVAIVPVKEE